MAPTSPPTRDVLDDLLRALDAQTGATATVTIETRRFGKTVTIIGGLEGRRDVQDLLRTLKQGLATGGSTKDGRIELQGDHRRRAVDILAAQGVKVSP